MLAKRPAYRFTHSPSGLSYPTGSAYLGGVFYSSRRAIIASRNPDEVRNALAGGYY